MVVNNIAMKAYTNALKAGGGLSRTNAANPMGKAEEDQKVGKAFSETINESIKEVNAMQEEKENMIASFASGETQNVHELMITLQKASIAMKMTSAVRNKVMEAYKQVMQMPF